MSENARTLSRTAADSLVAWNRGHARIGGDGNMDKNESFRSFMEVFALRWRKQINEKLRSEFDRDVAFALSMIPVKSASDENTGQV